jgi:CheY-like chemotaxis protein
MCGTIREDVRTFQHSTSSVGGTHKPRAVASAIARAFAKKKGSAYQRTFAPTTRRRSDGSWLYARSVASLPNRWLLERQPRTVPRVSAIRGAGCEENNRRNGEQGYKGIYREEDFRWKAACGFWKNRDDVFLVRDALTVDKMPDALQIANMWRRLSISLAGPVARPSMSRPLLLAINLPKVNGIEVQGQIRKHPSCADTPVILFSSPVDRKERALLAWPNEEAPGFAAEAAADWQSRESIGETPERELPSTKRRNPVDEYQSLSHTKWDCKYQVVFVAAEW